MDPITTLFIVVFAMLQVSLICNTVYLHRYITHRSIEVRHPFARRLMEAMHAWLAVLTGLNSLKWAELHTEHHDYRKTDPYNPKGKGQWHVFFWTWRYYGSGKPTEKNLVKYEPDWVDKLAPFMRYRGMSGLFICLCIGVAARHGSWHGLLYGFGAWGLHLLFFAIIFSALNGFAHEGGADVGGHNAAINSRLLLLLSWGEGWHKNHHDHPGWSRFALLDPAWMLVILPLECLGWVGVPVGAHKLNAKAAE